MKIKSLFLTSVATLGLTVATMAQNVPSYVPTSGLVGWWPFNGNANDESGNGNNGTVNGATLTIDRSGNANSAYSFNPALNSHIIIPFSNSINSIQTGITLSAWIYMNGGTPAGTPPRILELRGAYGNGGDAGFVMLSTDNNNSSRSFDLRWYSNSGNSNLMFNQTKTTLTSLNWHLISFTADGTTGIAKYYFDGVLQSTSTGDFVTQCNYNNNQLFLGAESNLLGKWGGKLDDIGIWNRALSQQEISALFNGCQLSVKTQPSNQTANINNNVQFVVSSSDSNATYQWQTDLGFGFQNLTNAGQYSGAQNDTLLVSNVTLTNNNQNFRCIVKSGSCMDTSKIAVLTVNNKVGVNKISQTNSFSVYPNPTQNIINVKADSKLIGGVYSIYDNMGRVVLTGKIHAENTTIELGSISDGVYSFNIGGNMNQIFKVIKK
jgi:hypothetical protein